MHGKTQYALKRTIYTYKYAASTQVTDIQLKYALMVI